jgi:predicted enzyme involved in methoxymalonyl-ACP biosynthesis
VIDWRQDRVAAVPLLMMSCRAIGRGVIDSLLTWLAGRAARHGATAVQVPCPVSERSVPLRLALASAGFRACPDQAAGPGRTVFRCDLGTPQPALPGWVTVPGET